MSNKEINHLIFATIINLVLTGVLIKTAWDGNDKAIIFVVFFYPILILVNLIIWITLSSRRKSEFKIYRVTTIGLIILFLPVLIVASLH